MQMEQERLKELIERARQGNPAAREALLAAIRNRVCCRCKKMLKHERDVQDAAQDVLSAITSRGKPRMGMTLDEAAPLSPIMRI